LFYSPEEYIKIGSNQTKTPFEGDEMNELKIEELKDIGEKCWVSFLLGFLGY
jgi:hypothetical protein